MSDYALEIELKYAATPAALAALGDAKRLGPALLGATVVNDETDRYLDTPDRRLSAAAWACRLRTRRVEGVARTFVSLKGPAEPAVAEMHRRPEIEAEAPDDPDPAAWPPSAARELVDRLRAGRPLVEVVGLAQLRRERPVVVDGRRIGTLSLDDVTVVRPDAVLGRFGAVELELGRIGDDDLLDALARDLAAIPGLRADGRTKLEHALAFMTGSVTGDR
jgi:inorganic triphosphatase YgiF